KFTAFWVIEYCIFVKDLVDCSATTHGVIFAKYVAQITKQQGRYAVGHGLSRCTHRKKVVPRRGVLIVQIIDCRNQACLLKNLGSRHAFCSWFAASRSGLPWIENGRSRMTRAR